MMTINSLSYAIDTIISKGHAPAETLNDIVQTVGLALRADRCFLYVRQPDRQHGRIALCWRKDDTIPDVIQPDWQSDTTDLPQEDPLFRAAIEGRPSVYVTDVDTTTPDVVNREFEQKTFGHRALIHAHIQAENQLWGILQPCVFGEPRQWTSDEKMEIEAILPHLYPVIQQYVTETT